MLIPPQAPGPELKSLVSSLLPNTLRIISGMGTDTAPFEFIQTLNLGQFIKGSISKILPEGKAVLQFGGNQVVAETSGPVVAGQALNAKVEQLGPNPVLKMIPQADTSLSQEIKTGTQARGVHANEQGFSLRLTTPFGGNHVVAEISGPVVAGQALNVKVEQLGPNPVLKMIPQGDTPLPQEIKTDMQARLVHANKQGFSLRLTAPSTPISHLTANDLEQLDVKPGQIFQIRVDKVQDSNKVLARFKGKEIVLERFRGKPPLPGGDVSLKAESVDGKFRLVYAGSSERSIPVDLELIKSYLPARKPLGEMVVQLKDTISKTLLLKELNIDPKLIERIWKTLQLLSPQGERVPDAAQIREQIGLSGINYESKIRNILMDGALSKAGNPALSEDLKGQLLLLQSRIQNYLNKEGAPQIQNRPTMELLQNISQAADNIELNQLTQQFSKQENQPVLVQIPNPFGSGDKTVKLYIRNLSDGPNEKKQGQEQQYNLVFLLELSSLGAIRVDTLVLDDQVAVKISVESESLARFIEHHSPVFQKSMDQLGYKVTLSCCVKSVQEMEIKDEIQQLLVDRVSRLVDVKT